MNLRFKTNLLEHTKAVGAWAQARGARASIDAADLSLQVTRGPRTLHLWPQFVGKRDGQRLVYFDTADRHAIGFVGWLPYKPQAWDLSRSKLVFKQAATELGIPTPVRWAAPAEADGPFVVKRASGAFGYGMHGPYPPGHALLLADGEFCETFHLGRIARAWYWSGTLTVLELFDMPTVTGDGRSTYTQLLRQASVEVPDDFATLAALQGVQPGDVLPAGRRVVCDYRYVSPFNPTLYANANRLPRLAGTPLAERFADAGRRLWPRIPGPPQRQAGFVLDAIVDADDRPWFLEINSNPQGHPDAYAAMLDACLPA